MLSFPNCKINLGLNITGKRPDGYHNLQTIFFPVPLQDILEIIVAPDPSAGPVQFTSSGLAIPGSSAGNLCVKAYQLLKADFPHLPAVQIHLHKIIPMGAGLGGGSSNGAFTLRLLNTKFELRLSRQQLLNYALQLGSDCPFFIINEPCLATGRGELLEPLDLSLEGYSIVLVNAGIHISTAAAFAAIKSQPSPMNLSSIVSQPVSSWKNQLYNDFEPGVFDLHPRLAAIKQKLYDLGACYAAMTGTGSTIFGLFNKLPDGVQDEFEGCFVKSLTL